MTYAIYIFTIQLHSVQITREASKCTHGKCTPENHFNSLVLVFCGNAAAKNTGVKEKKNRKYKQTNKQAKIWELSFVRENRLHEKGKAICLIPITV